ncbi:TetR/AcrR family transcriptional regulator [Nonomuraea sp. NPDC050556]|uniref:TetR/AcrR family transcriptional regulator n=1 Tax=Nonomuraea sp. NPDC050556 TaxID=3364369 RepID=UPI003788D1BC
MTSFRDPVTRASRILDAAAELLVSWGYRRVTIDEVAKRAAIGKGTVYLHFATKEQLFLAVVMRSQSRWAERFLDDVAADPAAALPSGMARSVFLAVHADPVLRAVLLSDRDTLGVLAKIAEQTSKEVLEHRERTIGESFRILREHGLVADDRPVATQLHAYAAIITGFLTIEPMLPTWGGTLEANADMLAHVIRSGFEPPPDEERLRAAAPLVADLYRSLLERLKQEIP